MITSDPALTKPLGSALVILSPTWINTGAGGTDFSNPSDTTVDPFTASGLLGAEVTNDCGIRVSVASLTGEGGSTVVESTPSFSVEVVLEASPFSMAAGVLCLFLFFFFFFFAAAVYNVTNSNLVCSEPKIEQKQHHFH